MKEVCPKACEVIGEKRVGMSHKKEDPKVPGKGFFFVLTWESSDYLTF
jgi:hypothetical protein